MKRIALISMLILCVAQIASAQDWAKATLEKSPRHREWVTVKHDNRSVETFVVYPESKSKTPVVLVIHEIFGMTDWVQDLADQVAAAGYIAVAPDLLSGMGPNGGRSSDFAEGKTMEAVSHLNPDQVAAAFVFYGGPPDKDAMARIKAPVYGFYAGNDARIGATIPDAVAQMKAASKAYDIVTYEGAGHGFMRAGEAPDAKGDDKKARADAWIRWKSLLAK